MVLSAQQLRQLRDVGGDTPRPVFAQRLRSPSAAPAHPRNICTRALLFSVRQGRTRGQESRQTFRIARKIATIRLKHWGLSGKSRTMQNDAFFSPKMRTWYAEAYAEIGVDVRDFDTRFAIFPMRFFKTIESFDHTKIYDFCFIGSFLIDKETATNRAWIIDFIKKHFSEKSYLQFTDKNTKLTHKPMGSFDHTLKQNGFVPKEVSKAQRNFFDENYYRTMCRSKFTLCPGGDRNWSMRFYEALICKSIPIILDRHALRTFQEANPTISMLHQMITLNFVSNWSSITMSFS